MKLTRKSIKAVGTALGGSTGVAWTSNRKYLKVQGYKFDLDTVEISFVDASSRMTATRFLAVGFFALAAKKQSVTVRLTDPTPYGPMVREVIVKGREVKKVHDLAVEISNAQTVQRMRMGV